VTMAWRAAVIGCGKIGSEYDDDPKRKRISSHAGAYSSVKGAKLVAVADVNREKAAKCKERWDAPASYHSAEEMFAKEKIDIVSICTHPDSHAELVRLAARHGVKAIFCEKPMAKTLAEADEMIALCEKNGILLMIDHQRRFDSLYRQVRSSIMEGKLGKPRQASFYYVKGIMNTGSHMFDMMRFLFGDVKEVIAFPSANPSSLPDDPNLDGFVTFKDGMRCCVQALDVDEYGMFEIDIYGSLGRLRISHYGSGFEYYAAMESRQFSGMRELYPAKAPFDAKPSKSPLVEGVKHMLACLDGKEEPVSTGEDGRRALELVQAFKESAKTGKTVIL